MLTGHFRSLKQLQLKHLNYIIKNDKFPVYRKTWIKSLMTNMDDCTCDRQRYMKQVIKNFNDLNRKRTSINSKTKLKELSGTEMVNKAKVGEIDIYEQKQIDDLLTNRLMAEASVIIECCISDNRIPHFKSLKQICAWSSQQGLSEKIRTIQRCVRNVNSDLLEEHCRFDHYLCEALFREGMHDEALNLLNKLLTKYSSGKPFKLVRETASYIIKIIQEVPEEIQTEAFEIAKKFITLRNYVKPAVFFWKTSILSEKFHLQNLARQLVEDYPFILDEKEDFLIDMVTEAHQMNNTDQLQVIIELCLKANYKKPLHEALSSLLSLYCMMENVACAEEIINFTHEEKLSLSADSVSQYLNLLHKKKHPTSFTLLTYLHGLRISKSKSD